ncbi:hypothetical protein ACIGFN_08390 [Streptomyces filamentosus]|uniref:hypothetical protein n=1 Tax=Streptomyces filamentosus TaxID=67294 RepID=UPI0037CFF5A4
MSVGSVGDEVLAERAPRRSLGTAAARNLASTTRSAPQVQEISSRRLLRTPPRVEAKGGAYQVDRRLGHAVGDGRVTFVQTGERAAVIPAELGELPALRGCEGEEVSAEPPARRVQRQVTAAGTSSIICVRTGESDQGVVGLHRTGLPDEVEPGLSVRFTGIGEQAIVSYLVTTYYSAAVLVPDALGVLESVEISRRR